MTPRRPAAATTQGGNNTKPRQKRGKLTSPNTLAIRQKQQRALDLRTEGWTFAQIAPAVGYADAAAAFNAVQTVLARSESESADELRVVHAERLSAAYREVLPLMRAQFTVPELPESWDNMGGAGQAMFLDRVEAGISADREMKLKAADRLVRLMEREAKLHGLDAPARQDVTSNGGSITVSFDPALAPDTTP